MSFKVKKCVVCGKLIWPQKKAKTCYPCYLKLGRKAHSLIKPRLYSKKRRGVKHK
jgi:hypothetical protein